MKTGHQDFVDASSVLANLMSVRVPYIAETHSSCRCHLEKLMRRSLLHLRYQNGNAFPTNYRSDVGL